MPGAEIESGNGTGRRVLVVDDDRNFADGVKSLLTLEAYEVATANDAGQARELIETFEAEVAILDFRLGRSVGVDLIAPLTERRPGLVCILLTAYEDADTVVKALRCGAYDYIRKPVHDHELLATLDRCFEKRRLVAANVAAEEALREAKKMEAVGRVVGGVAHHFNNAFAAIYTGVELLENPTASMDRSAISGHVLSAVTRASKINRSLLSFARRQALRPIEFDLRGYLMKLTEELRRDLGDSIAFTLSVADDVGDVRLDRDQLGSALGHLVSNAKAAMPRGGRVTIEVSEVEFAQGAPAPADDLTPGAYVVIAVDDTGSGIAPDIMDRVFEPFFTGKSMAEADGLGLSMVYGFAKQSGGGVSIESETDKGTTVRLYLPRGVE